MGALGTQQGTQNLACVNALATLGGQQQTIAQNAQNYPLTKLASLASLLQGYSIPTTTKTTLCMSPLSGLSAVGAIAKGIACSPALTGALAGAGSWLGGKLSGTTTPDVTAIVNDQSQCEVASGYWDDCGVWHPKGSAHGGLIKSHAAGGSIGCITEQAAGGMPSSDICSGMVCSASAICTPYQMARGGLMSMIRSGHIGCMSTKNRGALPSKG
jgi:hypothetical protein